MVRLVDDAEPVREALEACVGSRATVEYGVHVPPARFHVPDGMDASPVSFTTDAPLLSNWGRPMLYGPGSIHVAHRPDEHVAIADLRAAVDAYEGLVRALLATAEPSLLGGRE